VADSVNRIDQTAVVTSRILLVASGLLIGLIGSFLIPQRVDGIAGVTVLIALVGNLVGGLVGGLGLRSVGSAALVGVGWFVALAMSSFYLPGGDVIVPGSLGNDPRIVTVGEGFMVAGVVGTAAAMVLTAGYIRRRRPPTPTG
jgi:hypothetical protein